MAYNTRGPTTDQLEGGWAEVYSGGGVFYSRPGTLDIVCKFQGLVSFPFDTDVRCDLDMGGWLIDGSAQGIYLQPGSNPGVDFHTPGADTGNTYAVAAERTSGSTYVEYALTNVTAKMSNITYGEQGGVSSPRARASGAQRSWAPVRQAAAPTPRTPSRRSLFTLSTVSP